MHELRIAEEIAAIVIRSAETADLRKVTRVNVVFGQMTGIVPESFEAAYKEVVKGTAASDSIVGIESVPGSLRCRECGQEFRLTESMFTCSHCGSPDVDLVNGMELFIKSIEGE